MSSTTAEAWGEGQPCCPQLHPLVVVTEHSGNHYCDICASPDPQYRCPSGCDYDICTSCQNEPLPEAPPQVPLKVRVSSRSGNSEPWKVLAEDARLRMEPRRVVCAALGRVFKKAGANEYVQTPDKLLFLFPRKNLVLLFGNASEELPNTAVAIQYVHNAGSTSRPPSFDLQWLIECPSRWSADSFKSYIQPISSLPTPGASTSASPPPPPPLAAPSASAPASAAMWLQDLASKAKSRSASESAGVVQLEETKRRWETLLASAGGPSASLAKLLRLALETYAQSPCIGTRQWQESENRVVFEWMTFAEFGQRVIRCAAALRQLLARRPSATGYRVGICADNCPSWILVDWACLITERIVVVPLHPSLSVDTLCHVIASTPIDLIFGDAATMPKLTHLQSVCPSVRYVVALDPLDLDLCPILGPPPERYVFAAADPPRQRDSVITILFSSGTTGTPKGMLIPERAWINRFTQLLTGVPSTMPVWPVDSNLSLTAPRTNTYDMMIAGGRIAFVSPGLGKWIGGDLCALHPTTVLETPRVLEGLWSLFQQELQADPSNRKNLIAKFRAMSGGAQSLTTGGAKTSPHLLAWLGEVFGSHVVNESYGSSEVGGISSNGRIMPGVHVRLKPWGDCQPTDRPPRGELWVRSEELMLGYVGTDTPCDGEGFFATGDIVELIPPPGFADRLFDPEAAWVYEIRVIDRKSGLVKLSCGEFVSPATLEQIYGRTPGVRQVYVHAAPGARSIAAVVVPACAESTASELQSAMRATGTQHDVRPWEIPQLVILADEEFTEANGLITNTGKLARRAVAQRYCPQLNLADAPTGDVSSTDLIARLCHRLEQLSQGELENEADKIELKSLGCDSVTRMLLIGIVGKTYGIRVPYKASESISSLRAFLFAGGGASSASMVMPLDEDNELFWEYEIENALGVAKLFKSYPVDGASSSSAPPTARNVVLLTGATGFVGGAILKDLLQRTPWIIRCPVRGKVGPQELIQRIHQAGYEVHLSWLPRVQVVDCELGSLTPDEAHALMAEANILAIIHCAALPSLARDYRELYSLNVRCPLLLLGAAAKCGVAFHFISTLGVWGDGVGEESSLPPPPLSRRGYSGYDQSKWVADRAIMTATSSPAFSIPITIIRLPLITGSSTTGAWSLRDWLPCYLLGCMQIGAFPLESNTHLIIAHCPVDVTATAIVNLSGLLPGSFPLPGLYHIPTGSLAFEKLMKLFAAANQVEIVALPHHEWLQKLLAAPPTNPLGPFVHSVAAHPFSSSQSHKHSLTRSVLEKTGWLFSDASQYACIHIWAKWLLREHLQKNETEK